MNSTTAPDQVSCPICHFRVDADPTREQEVTHEALHALADKAAAKRAAQECDHAVNSDCPHYS